MKTREENFLISICLLINIGCDIYKIIGDIKKLR